MEKRRGKHGSKSTASPDQNKSQDGYISTIRPKGSFDNRKIHIEKRELIRPKINYWRAALNIIIPLIICTMMSWWNSPFALVSLGLYSLLRFRGIIIWFIRVYQRYAPEEVRLSCVFEPSCSEYMILSIKKFGVIWGGIKGIKRLRRCHLPNGGVDYP